MKAFAIANILVLLYAAGLVVLAAFVVAAVRAAFRLIDPQGLRGLGPASKGVKRGMDSVSRATVGRIKDLIDRAKKRELSPAEKDEFQFLDRTLRPSVDAMSDSWNKLVQASIDR